MTAKKAREFRFEIKAYSPETMPIDRLLQYLSELAVVLGDNKAVHLLRVEHGSTVPVLRVEREAVVGVRERVRAVNAGAGPSRARDAAARLNKYLREDNARAVLREWRRGPRLLEFPGIDESENQYPSVKQAGTISGILLRVGGAGEKVPVLLESDGEQLAGCHTNRETAMALGHHLYKPLRLIGFGYWHRDAEGEWHLNHFRIEGFEPLEDTGLSESLAELRRVAGDWDRGAYDDLKALRRGWSPNGGD